MKKFLLRLTDNAGWALFGILAIFIVLPYIITPGQYLVGGDLGYFEDTAALNYERMHYVWSDFSGAGGLTAGRSGNEIHFLLTSALNSVLSPVGTQIVTKLLFYGFGFSGIYLLLRKYSQEHNLNAGPLHFGAIALFFCTSLISFDFLRSWMHLYYVFFLVTPLLLYWGWLYVRQGYIHQLLIFVAFVVVNMPSFTNPSYPPIQIMTIFGLLWILAGWSYRIPILFFFYLIVNTGSIIEYLQMMFQAQGAFLSSDFNKRLVEDYIISQKQYFSLDNLFTFSSGRLYATHWSYNGSVRQFLLSDVYKNPLFQTILLTPIAIIIAGIRSKQKDVDRTHVYIAGFFLLSLVLTAMHGFLPLEGLFRYAFESIPQLAIFRNSLKFSVLVMLLASFLLLKGILVKKTYLYVFIAFLAVLNIYALSGNFINYYAMGAMPDVYKNLNETFSHLPHSPADRCMIYPTSDNIWYGFKFHYYGFSPVTNSQNQLGCFSKTTELTSSTNHDVYDLLKYPENMEVTDWKKYDVRYVFVHKDVNYSAFNQVDTSESIRSYFETRFKKVVDNSNYTIYETYEQPAPLVALASRLNPENVQSKKYKKIDPTYISIYPVTIHSGDKLIFAGAYHPGWRLVLQPLDKDLSVLGRIFARPIFVDRHEQTSVFLNSWAVDADYIKSTYSKEYYRTTSDGGIEVRVILQFQPQTSAMIAEWVSWLALVGLVAVAVVTYVARYIRRNSAS